MAWIVIVLCGTFVFAGSYDILNRENVNLTCRQMPLKDVVDSISKQTGYTIHVESDLLTMPVTGKFNNVKIESIFRRIFRGKNISLLFSEKEKSCIVKTFGDKKRKYYTASHAGPSNTLIGLPAKELALSREKQLRAFREFSQNPNSVDSLTGLKLGEIKASRQLQREAFIKQSRNAGSVDSLTGNTLEKLNRSYNRQRKEFLAYSENVKSVDPIIGKKVVDVHRSYERQRKAFQEYSNNPASVDPLTGLTLGQIRASQRQQRKKFEAGTENVR